jgi:trk system potassium uptake protein TrkA
MWVETTSRDIVILGGTIVGMRLASLLAQDQRKRYVRLIEKNDAHCREMSRLLTGVVIVNGDFTEPDLQSSENIFRSDVLVSVTNQDDTNLLMCMSAQKYSTNKIVSRYLKKEYKDIFMFTGLATIIGFNGIVANEVSKCVMSESKVLLRMRNHEELFFVHEVTQQSKLFDRYYGDLVVPEGIRIVSIYRQGQPIYPAMDTKFAEGDRVIVFTNMINSKGLSKVFGRNAVSES